MRVCLAVLTLGAAVLGGCAETALLPPDSPENPASTSAAEAPADAPSVLAEALPAVGAKPAIAPTAAPMDHSHHHHDSGTANPAKGDIHP